MLHTDIPCHSDIEALSAARELGCVSIYLPTNPVTTESEADRVQFKNLVSEAVARLESVTDLPRGAAKDIEESLCDLLDDDVFWAYQANSLVVFATPQRVLTYRLANGLSPFVSVSDRFYLKPLLRALATPQSAFVLALAQGGVRVVEVSRDLPAFTVDLADMPADIAAAQGKASILDRSPRGRIQGSEGQKVRMRQYARQVDAAMRSLLAGKDTPLILAATAPLDSIYRSVNTYPFLVKAQIEGNAEKLADAELASAARPILDAIYADDMAQIAGNFADRKARGLATTDTATVARAATFGAVDVLLVDIDANVPGSIDETTGAIQVADPKDPDAYGVLDEVARRVLVSGGQVKAVRAHELPDGAEHIAALLRFPI